MTINTEVTDMVEKMSPALRAEVFAALAAKKAENEKTGGAKLLTPSMSAAVDNRNKVMIKQLVARCARQGFNLRDDKLVDLAELNKAFKESNTPEDERWGIKTHLAQLSLIR